MQDRGSEVVARTLKIVFGLVPIVAGLDKFTDILTNWDKYLAPPIAHALPIAVHPFMLIVGVIEIVAGLCVLFTPWTRLFATIVGLWLIGIALDLVIGGFYDIAVRDTVMAIASFCLARLAVPAETRAAARTPATA